MAAPPSETLADLSGKWQMNKTLSQSPDAALQLQGISWLTRKAIGLSTVTLDITQYTGPPSPPSSSTVPVTHLEIAQTATGGIKGTSEKRCLDYVWREHSDWMFGHVKGQSRWVKKEEIGDTFLEGGWIEEGEYIESYVESLENGWTARQIWGFQMVNGERRYCRNIVVRKGEEKVEFRLVYDWLE